MHRKVDVAVVGADHAGLNAINAIKDVRKVTRDFVLINGGPLGTTCASIGCMPSKVAIHLAAVSGLKSWTPGAAARFLRWGHRFPLPIDTASISAQ